MLFRLRRAKKMIATIIRPHTKIPTGQAATQAPSQRSSMRIPSSVAGSGIPIKSVSRALQPVATSNAAVARPAPPIRRRKREAFPELATASSPQRTR